MIFSRIALSALIFLQILPPQAVIAAQDPEFVDFSHLSIVSRAERLLEEEEDEESTDSDSISKSLTQKLSQIDLGRKRDIVLNFSQSNISDEVFQEMTDSLIPKIPSGFDHFLAFDLSFNNLTSRSLENIKRWEENLIFEFIDIHGNPKCSMRHVAEFCKGSLRIEKDEKKVSGFMRHVVFLPQHYIYQASTRVKIYKQLVGKGILNPDWPDRQRAYYQAVAGRRPISFSQEIFETDSDQNASLEE